MTAVYIQLSGQAHNWFGEEDRMDRFLTHCILFPYACKAVLRNKEFTDVLEEGGTVLRSGLLTEAKLGMTVQHAGPHACTDIMCRMFHEALGKRNTSRLPNDTSNETWFY